MCIFHLFCSDGGQLNTANTSHEKGGSDLSCIESMVDEIQSKDHFHSQASASSHPDITCFSETSKVSPSDIQNSGLYYGEISKVPPFDIQNTGSGLCNDEDSKITHPDIQITGLYKNKTFKATLFDIQDNEMYYGKTSNMLHPDIQNSDLYCGETSKVSHPDIQNSGLSAMHLVDHCYCKPSELQFILIDHCYSETSQVSHVGIQNTSVEWNFTNDVLQSKNQESDVEENIDETLFGVMEVVEIYDEYENLRASLQRDLRSPYVMNTNAKNIEILSFYESKEKTSVKYRIKVDEEFHVCLKVHNVEISRKHEIWDGLPKLYTKVQDIDLLLSKLNTFNVCCGNNDEELIHSFAQIGARITLLPVLSETSSSEIHESGYREGDFGASDQIGNCYDSTIRSVKCVLLVKGMRCCHCKWYRQSLQNRKYCIMSKQKKNIDFNASKYQHCYMTREMLIDKINQQKDDIKTLESEMTKLKRQYRILENQKKNEIEFLESRISKLKRQDKINQQKN